MDRQLIVEKLESLRRCVERVQSRCPPSADALARDIDAQDIVSVNLARAVQVSVDIAAHLIADSDVSPPETMGQAFERLSDAGIISTDLAGRLKSAVGFRNITVHSYRDIDWTIAFAVCTTRLGDFREFAEAVRRAAMK